MGELSPHYPPPLFLFQGFTRMHDWSYSFTRQPNYQALKLFLIAALNLLYTWVTKEILFTLVKLLKIENTFSFQLDVSDQLFLVLMKLKLN
jgi:hypothetical protein